jgi:hypothetical protein
MKVHNLKITGSIQNNGENLTQISSSVATVTSNLDARISSLEGNSGSIVSKTGSYATTGSNIFIGAQSISGSLTISGNLTAQQFIVSSSVTYLTESFASGSHKFGDSLDDNHDFTGSVRISGSIVATGTSLISGSEQLTGSLDGRYVLSGSITQTTWDNIASKPSGIVSGSSQLTGSYDTRYVLSGSITQTTWDNIASKPNDIVSSSSQISAFGFATTGSNSFTGSQKFTGSLIVSGTFNLNDSATNFNIVGNTFGQSYLQSPGGAIVLNPGYGGVEIVGVNNRFTALDAYITNLYISNGITGSLFGTSSYAMFALSASNAPGFTTNMTQTSAAATWSFVHNLNTRNPIVQVYDSSYNQIVPNEIVGIDSATAEIRFDYSQAGYAVASNGGGLYITGSTSRINQTSNATTWSFSHNLGTKYPSFEVFDVDDKVIIPAGIKATTINTAEIYFATPTSGVAIANFSGVNGFQENSVTSSFALTTKWNTIQDNPITGSLTSATAGTTTTILSVATSSYYGAFFDYVAVSGSNSRAGNVMSTWNGSSVVYNESTTNDIGNTNEVTMSVDLSGANVRLRATNTNQWSVRSLVRLI